MRPTACQVCGYQPLDQPDRGRTRIYCSTACRQRHYRAQRTAEYNRLKAAEHTRQHTKELTATTPTAGPVNTPERQALHTIRTLLNDPAVTAATTKSPALANIISQADTVATEATATKNAQQASTPETANGPADH